MAEPGQRHQRGDHRPYGGLPGWRVYQGVHRAQGRCLYRSRCRNFWYAIDRSRRKPEQNRRRGKPSALVSLGFELMGVETVRTYRPRFGDDDRLGVIGRSRFALGNGFGHIGELFDGQGSAFGCAIGQWGFLQGWRTGCPHNIGRVDYWAISGGTPWDWRTNF